MAVNEQIAISGAVGSALISGVLPIASHSSIRHSDDPVVAIAGILSTRTDDDTGILTVAEGHGIEGDDLITLFWDSGHIVDSVVDSVTATTITFGGVSPGTGDALPAEAEVVNCCLQVVVDSDFVANNAQAMGASSRGRMFIGFMESGTRQLDVELHSLNGYVWFWSIHDGAGATNPLAGHTIDEIRIAQADFAVVQVPEIGIAYNSP